MRYQSYTEHPGGGWHRYRFVTVPCPLCGSTETIEVNGPDLFRYNNGTLIQDAFPYLTAAQRERFMSGTCGPCFAGMFAEAE